MYRISRTSPETGKQKQAYSKFFMLRWAAIIVSVLALTVEGVTDYFSLYKTIGAFTARYGFSEWVPTLVSAALVIALTVAFYASASFVFSSLWDGDFRHIKDKKAEGFLPYAATVAFMLVFTAIYTLSTEGAQMVAGEYFSEKAVITETASLMDLTAGDIENKKEKEIQDIEKRYQTLIAAQESAGKAAVEKQRERFWEKSKIARIEGEQAAKMQRLQEQRVKDIQGVNELRDGQIKAQTEMKRREYERVSANNERQMQDADARNERNKRGGWYIAFFCLPLTTVCIALKTWMDNICGIRLDVTVSRSDFEQNPFGKLLFAVKDGLSGQIGNAAVKIHRAISPRERLNFTDMETRYDGSGNWGVATKKSPTFIEEEDEDVMPTKWNNTGGIMGIYKQDFEKKK